MIRGTTAPFKIKLPYTRGELEWITIKWWQDGNKGTVRAPLPITKRLAHCAVSNIYTCKLSSDIAANESCYFTINGVMYGFVASQDIGAESLLKYNTKTKSLTVGDSTILPEVIGNKDNMTELMFVNEANNSNELYVSLTAEETMRFSDKHKAKMQLRAMLASNGRVFGCKPRLITVYPINDELLEDDIVSGSGFDDEWIVLDGKAVANE